jgi:hypothetical protein
MTTIKLSKSRERRFEVELIQILWKSIADPTPTADEGL